MDGRTGVALHGAVNDYVRGVAGLQGVDARTRARTRAGYDAGMRRIDVRFMRAWLDDRVMGA